MRTWPPGACQYSQESFQQAISGSIAGVLTARLPPGLRMRWSSAIVTAGSGTCSTTSVQTMWSKVLSGKGRRSPSASMKSA
jgi:hypothetical protein